MRKTMILAAAAAVVGLAGTAFAGHNEPAKGNKFQSTVVTGYTQCAAPNTAVTGAIPLPACSPATMADPVCGFDLKGQGQIQAIVSGKGATSDIKLQAKLQGLQLAGCVGAEYCAVATLRVTTDACADLNPAGCTVVDLVDFPIPGACATVDAKGKLQIKTTVNTGTPGLVTGGNNVGYELAGVGLRRTGAGAAGFRTGLVNP